MTGLYEVRLTTDAGRQLALLDQTLGFSISRVVNDAGSFNMTLPATFDKSLLQPDYMVQFWRAPADTAQLALWRTYFLRRRRFETRGARETIRIEGPDVNDLARRRIVAYFAGSTQATKNTNADDMMKDVVSEAIIDGVNPAPAAGTRVWANLSVQANSSSGPILRASFAWKRVLDILIELSKASREAGTEVFWDIVPLTISGASITFEFRTTLWQPGQNLTSSVVFEQERGNLEDPFLDEDWTQEINYVYAGGQGQGEAREVQQVSDAARYNVSQWARIEGTADARNQSSANATREAGRAALEIGRPRRRFGGIPVDTAGTQFGVDWNHGDMVRAKYQGDEFDAIIRVTNITVRNMKEKVTARLDYRSDW